MTTVHARYFRINAFVPIDEEQSVNPLSTGNPAAVVLLTQEQDAMVNDDRKQALATELNLSETAFVTLPSSENLDRSYNLRWFTPAAEVSLCGHATLAAAAALVTGGVDKGVSIHFQTLSGELKVRHADIGDAKLSFSMSFPLLSGHAEVLPEVRSSLLQALQIEMDEVSEVYTSDFDLVVILRKAAFLRAVNPNMGALRLAAKDSRGVIVAAECESSNEFGNAKFVSRFFAPAFGIPEDPVTGSAHCALAARFVQDGESVIAKQISSRGGTIGVSRGFDDEFVNLKGVAAVVVEGTVSF